MPKKIQDEAMVGKVFGYLTVLRRFENKDRWVCICNCGIEGVKGGKNLRVGDTKSCGCLKKEVKPPPPRTTHGMSDTPTYIAWRNMKARCNDENHPAYKNYGERGVTYQESWECFGNFLEDMGECPEGLTLDRTDVMKNYTKANCEWVSSLVQSTHKRKTTKPTTSKYKGVCFKEAEGKYVGTLCYSGKRYHLGYSDSEKFLAELYDNLLEKLTGSGEGTNKKLGYL